MVGHTQRRIIIVLWAFTICAVAAITFCPISANASFGRETTKLNGFISITYPESLSNRKFIFFGQVLKAYSDVSSYLGIQGVKFTIEIGDYSKPQVVSRTNLMKYPLKDVEKHSRFYGLWHEMVHVVTKTGSDIFGEGLAEHVRFKLARVQKEEVHKYIPKDYFEDTEIFPSAIRYEQIGHTEGLDSKLRKKTKYDVANSFVTYLINDVLVGTEADRISNFMEFYMQKNYSDSALKKHFGKTFQELDAGWYKMLQTRYDFKSHIPEVVAQSDNEIRLRSNFPEQDIQDIYDAAKAHCATYGKTNFLMSNAESDGFYTFSCK